MKGFSVAALALGFGALCGCHHSKPHTLLGEWSVYTSLSDVPGTASFTDSGYSITTKVNFLGLGVSSTQKGTYKEEGLKLHLVPSSTSMGLGGNSFTGGGGPSVLGSESTLLWASDDVVYLTSKSDYSDVVIGLARDGAVPDKTKLLLNLSFKPGALIKPDSGFTIKKPDDAPATPPPGTPLKATTPDAVPPPATPTPQATEMPSQPTPDPNTASPSPEPTPKGL
jgi:hypothetical protein